MVEGAVLDLLGFYQRDLRENGEGRDALGRLGITEPAVIEHFGLGYASGQALNAAGEPQRRELSRLGLVCRRREVLQGCVVVPVYEVDGQLVDLCGLRPYKSGLRAFYDFMAGERMILGNPAKGLRFGFFDLYKPGGRAARSCGGRRMSSESESVKSVR